MTTLTQSKTQAQIRADFSVMPMILAALTGAILVYFAGFAEASVFHNTAHDSRHTLAFPCH